MTKMDPHEMMRIRAAAYRATRVYPGSVGQLIARELNAWVDFGEKFGGDGLIKGLVDDVMKKVPPPTHIQEKVQA